MKSIGKIDGKENEEYRRKKCTTQVKKTMKDEKYRRKNINEQMQNNEKMTKNNMRNREGKG